LREKLEVDDRLFDLLTKFFFDKKYVGIEEWEKRLKEQEYPLQN